MTTDKAVVWAAGLQEPLEHGALDPSSCLGRLKMEPGKTPKKRQKEDEEDHEQEQVYMKGHKDPHCLKWGEGRAPVSGKISRVERVCQAVGKEG